MAVEKGESVYYAGIFAPKNAPIRTIQDLKHQRVAFGDVNSASSFTYQVAMMVQAGLDPPKDLKEIRITGSHANSIAALSQGLVDAACLSFDSYEKAVREGAVDASVHTAPGITPEMIRGYGGKKVDRYNANFSEAEFKAAADKLALVTDQLKSEMLQRSAER